MAMRTYGFAMQTTTMKPGAAIWSAGRRVSAKVTSLVYLPALLIPAVALLLLAVGFATGWGGADFASSLTSLRFVTMGQLAAGLIVLCTNALLEPQDLAELRAAATFHSDGIADPATEGQENPDSQIEQQALSFAKKLRLSPDSKPARREP